VRGVTTNALIILDGLALLADERLINDLLTIEAGDGRGTD
jgi:hypothetical protein